MSVTAAIGVVERADPGSADEDEGEREHDRHRTRQRQASTSGRPERNGLGRGRRTSIDLARIGAIDARRSCRSARMDRSDRRVGQGAARSSICRRVCRVASSAATAEDPAGQEQLLVDQLVRWPRRPRAGITFEPMASTTMAHRSQHSTSGRVDRPSVADGVRRRSGPARLAIGLSVVDGRGGDGSHSSRAVATRVSGTRVCGRPRIWTDPSPRSRPAGLASATARRGRSA